MMKTNLKSILKLKVQYIAVKGYQTKAKTTTFNSMFINSFFIIKPQRING